MMKVLIFAAVVEAVTGLTMLTAPSLVGQLLLGDKLAGAAILVARVTGIALIGLGVACWPGPPVVGMFVYSAVVTLYLFTSEMGLTGALLWPAVALHLCSCQFFLVAFGLPSKPDKEPTESRDQDGRLANRMIAFGP